MKKINKINKQNKGQIAIIILLVSAVVLTIGLSASKSTVTDTKVDTDEELLKEAFNTAESAINNYLDAGGTTYTTEGSNAIVDPSPIGNTQSLSSEGQVLINSNQLFWLVNHNTDDSIGTDYYSGDNITLSVDGGFSGALKIDYFYIDGVGEYKVKRLGCNYGGSSLVNGFSSDTSSCATIDLSIGDPLLISITPIGLATSLTISGSSNFPLQGEEITAASSTDNGVKTQIKTRNIYQIPSFFIDAITAKNIIQ